ncbi:MAG: glutamate--tRNA ligase [Acidobacteriota bacterium]
MTSNVRVRVAPSPTGDPHIGTAYQALFNYAFARRHGGQFVLRIEDTDRERSHVSSERAILDSLRWLGLQWDEGPDVGGPHGPYRQSERLELYQDAAYRLLESGHAYRDFMTREELQELRQREQANKTFEHYERRDRDLPSEESEARAAAGEVHTVRLRVPLDGECTLQDLLRGEIRREWAIVDDQVLLKSDGFPTYHLANVVDDHEMGITHVIRGEEWINSVPKHLLLYTALGWEPPVFCHLPLLRNNDANKTKLSKRKNPTSIHYFRDAGFLAPCLVNYLALMGISRAEGEEKMALGDFVDDFDLEDVSLGGPVFDIDKLRWLNARYIREDLSPTALREALREWALSDENLDRIVPLAQPRLQTLSDWGHLTAFFFADDVAPDPELLTLKGKEPAEIVSILQIVTWRLEQLREWNLEALEETLRDCCDRFELKMRDFTRPLYVAISGSASSTPLFDSMLVLGPDLSRMRLRRAVDALGGLSKKRLKATEKQMQALWRD